jgi:hypothetical protein
MDREGPFKCSHSQEQPTVSGADGRFCRDVPVGPHRSFALPGTAKAFWIAARRWTMRAIETGVLSVDCLKAPQTSVHAEADALCDEQ